MKKQNKIKWFLMLAFAFLFLGTGCSQNVYDGGMCGNATANGTNEFSQIRNYYVAEYLAEKNAVETTKYIVENETIRVRIDTDIDYGTYLFVINSQYRPKDGNGLPSKMVGNYVATTNEVSYIELTQEDEEGRMYKFDGVDTTKVEKATKDMDKIVGLTTNYEQHVADTSRDEDGTKEILSVKQRLSAHSKACIVFNEPIQDPATGVMLQPKTWKQAFTEGGFLTGLIVYPVSWFLNLFVVWFGGNGTAQVFAIIVVTIILKLLIMLATFKSTLSTHKMQDIQPEIAKLQAKYGTNPSPEQRQRMSMEMMAVYKKYGVKPFAPFLSMIVTFPVFIAMYQAVIQTAVLRTGTFLGVVLGHTISSNIFGVFKWGALGIFCFMAITQVLSMKMPQFINRKRMTPEAKKMQKSTSFITYIFLVMILIMGFTMPATMSIYWIASAIVSISQTLIMHKVNGDNKNKGGKGGKYKVKKVEKKYTIPQGKIIDG